MRFQLTISNEVRDGWPGLTTSLGRVRPLPHAGPGIYVMVKKLDSPNLMPFGKDISCLQDCNSAKIQKYSACEESHQETARDANNSSCEFLLPLNYFLVIMSTQEKEKF